MALRLHSRLIVLNICALGVATLLFGYLLGIGIKSVIEVQNQQAVPIEALDLLFAGVRHELVPLVLASVGMTLLFGYLVHVIVSRPLRRLAEASQELAIGNLDREIPAVGDIDLARVGSSLNSMARNLRLRIEELREEKRQIEATVEAMSAGVVVFDRQARAVLANRAIRQLLEVSGELAGRTPMELVRHSAIETAVRQALHGHEIPAVDLTTGGGRVLLAKATPVRLLSGQVESAVVVFYDLTEVRRTEKMRKDFVANVSHEFKTPLTSIRGYAETLINAPPESKATAREFLQAIERNAGLLEALVEDLLVLAHLEADPPVQKQPLDLRSLIDRQVDSRRRMLDEKKIAVHLDCPDVPVSADRSRLERAVSNLLDNAIYYNRIEGQIHITTRQVSGGIAIDVADTGVGISPEELLRVFERFYRVEKSRARDSGGTGLGLAIARHAVESQGGSIAVSSKLGAGATFTITLPGE